MKQVSHRELSEIIKRTYETKISLYIWGGIGWGKSFSVKKTAQEIARQKKKKFIEWNKISNEQKRELYKKPKGYFIFSDQRASEIDVTEVKGLPNFWNGVVEWKSQLLFNTLSNSDADGIILYDELNLAMPSVLSSLYKVILDREVGDLSLNEDIGIIACSNRPQDYGGVYDLPEPLKNRFVHVELSLSTIKEWTDWALDYQIEPDIISYLNWKPSRLYSFDKKNKEMAFSSPRMWVTCSNLIKGITSSKQKEILISSAVGEGIALEFMTFLKLKNRLDVNDLLKNPDKIKKIEKVDEKYALLGAIVEKFRENQKILPNCLSVCRNLEAEFSILLFRYLANANQSIEKAKVKGEINSRMIDKWDSEFGKKIVENGGYDLVRKYLPYI